MKEGKKGEKGGRSERGGRGSEEVKVWVKVYVVDHVYWCCFSSFSPVCFPIV